MARSKAQCAREIIDTLKEELVEFFRETLGLVSDSRDMIATGLSGKGDFAKVLFANPSPHEWIDFHAVDFPERWRKILLGAGVASAELTSHKFLNAGCTQLDLIAVIKANGQYIESARKQ